MVWCFVLFCDSRSGLPGDWVHSSLQAIDFWILITTQPNEINSTPA